MNETNKSGTSLSKGAASLSDYVGNQQAAKTASVGIIEQLAEGQSKLINQLVLTAERAERLANRLFGAAPQRGGENASDAPEGIAYLAAQHSWQQVHLTRLEDAIERLERL